MVCCNTQKSDLLTYQNTVETVCVNTYVNIYQRSANLHTLFNDAGFRFQPHKNIFLLHSTMVLHKKCDYVEQPMQQKSNIIKALTTYRRIPNCLNTLLSYIQIAFRESVNQKIKSNVLTKEIHTIKNHTKHCLIITTCTRIIKVVYTDSFEIINLIKFIYQSNFTRQQHIHSHKNNILQEYQQFSSNKINTTRNYTRNYTIVKKYSLAHSIWI
eukprot:TRINITY_DN250_c1_g1_i2.p1 TRINITY_DN250_c1_g1~~TRINITY_DN250_c1_g1_i2.p1  ORF type:complete len:213 (+),score=-28.44 TRINITY_DN250_c1_g1_i2:720-1358(+)